jgi:glycosyltransferase involved in cell wall biosynthesis
MSSTHKNELTPLISVVIPTFNRAHTIERAVRSVLAQDVGEVEIIVVDDGSTDDTRSVIGNLGADGIRYILQEKSGAARARNAGIEVARGKFISFLDSDDQYLPNHLLRALKLLKADEKICIYAPVVVDRGTVQFIKPPLPYDNASPISEYLLCRRGFVPTSTLVLPAGLAREVRYDGHLKFGQDIDLAIRLVGAGARLVMLEQPGAVVRDHSSAGRVSSSTDVDNLTAWLERIRPHLTERAFLAYRGWHLAKVLARQEQMPAGLRHFVRALLAGAYSPRFSIAVLLQIVLPPAPYRSLADKLVRLGIGP